MEVIRLDHVTKGFKIYADRAVTLKEKALSRKRRQHVYHPVLNDINMSINKGEVVGLIGQNGCGKSTTLKLMTRILYPEKGTVTVRGRVSSLLELGAGFHPDVSGLDNIYTNAAIFGLSRKETDERLHRIIAFSELEDYINNPVRTYSSGMYMRLAFSVAINVDADILLVDEILAVGDTNFQAKCYRRMDELKEKGVTIVLVTHDVGTVEKFCNRAIWLNKGEVMADGRQIEVVDEYCRYMNERQIDRMRYDEQSAEETTETAPQAPPKSEEVPPEPEADPNHFGTKDVVIQSACLCGANGKKTKVLAGGERMELHIRYRVNKECPGYMFGMGFYTMNDTVVYATNTRLDGIKLNSVPGEGEIVFAIESLPLLTGEYKLNVAVVDQDETPLDFYRCYTRFSVISGLRSQGLVDIPHTWAFPHGVDREDAVDE